MADPLSVVLVRITLHLADGGVLEREWDGRVAPDPEMPGPPVWVERVEVRWRHPGEPVTVVGHVPAGREGDARVWLFPAGEAVQREILGHVSALRELGDFGEG